MDTIQAITMPKWGIEMQEGTVTSWHVAAGQSVAKHDPLVDVETEKIVNTVESPYAGMLRRVLAQPGSVVPVGALIAVYADPEVTDAELDAFVRGFKPADASFEPGEPEARVAAAEPAACDSTAAEIRATPIARRVAERLGVDLSRVRGTGPNGRISKDDVEAHAASLAVPGAAAGGVADVANPSRRTPLSGMRRTIARRLLASKQGIPHYRLERAINAVALLERRTELRAAGDEVSVNDLLLRACALALVRHPTLNAHLVGDDLETFENADICLAVATEQGLVTPVVHAANRLLSREVAARTSDLVARARLGQLSRDEIAGGTFTLSNLGMYGLDRFDAIINPPQVAILAVGAIREVPVIHGGRVVPGQLFNATLSCDHRAVDGAAGAAFLATLADLLAAPDSL